MTEAILVDLGGVETGVDKNVMVRNLVLQLATVNVLPTVAMASRDEFGVSPLIPFPNDEPEKRRDKLNVDRH
jgi:hypothetical protein